MTGFFVSQQQVLLLLQDSGRGNYLIAHAMYRTPRILHLHLHEEIYSEIIYYCLYIPKISRELHIIRTYTTHLKVHEKT